MAFDVETSYRPYTACWTLDLLLYLQLSDHIPSHLSYLVSFDSQFHDIGRPLHKHNYDTIMFADLQEYEFYLCAFCSPACFAFVFTFSVFPSHLHSSARACGAIPLTARDLMLQTSLY